MELIHSHIKILLPFSIQLKIPSKLPKTHAFAKLTENSSINRYESKTKTLFFSLLLIETAIQTQRNAA